MRLGAMKSALNPIGAMSCPEISKDSWPPHFPGRSVLILAVLGTEKQAKTTRRKERAWGALISGWLQQRAQGWGGFSPA